jgi:hypothetical protein
MTKETTETVEPCPHCGHKVKLEEQGGLIAVICPEESFCIGSGLGTFFLTSKRKEALEAWNRRVTQ